MENQLYKKPCESFREAGLRKGKQAGHFQNQKQSACISRIQSKQKTGTSKFPLLIPVFIYYFLKPLKEKLSFSHRFHLYPDHIS